MIPQHIIDKAVTAAGENWVMTFDWEHDKLHAQVHAALEAVAADIRAAAWEQGCSAMHYRIPSGFKGMCEIPNNPYRIETA